MSLKKLTYLIILLLLTACGGREIDSTYSSSTCEELAVMIEQRDSISQEQYTAMIGQNEAILKYLVSQSKRIAEQPDSLRQDSWRELYADPEYMERFGYMFTLGSALFQAQLAGKLDKYNQRQYDNLDKYNKELAEYSERN